MEKPEYHIFVCASFRADGDPKGVCHKKGSVPLLPYIENEILDRGLDAQITSTGSMRVAARMRVTGDGDSASGTVVRPGGERRCRR